MDKGDVYAKQSDVFSGIGKDIVMHAFNGVSSTCFAYGQTGTGITINVHVCALLFS